MHTYIKGKAIQITLPWETNYAVTGHVTVLKSPLKRPRELAI